MCAGLSESDWAAQSGCPGWSVQDVVSHLGAGYWMVADPSSRPAGEGLPFERAQDALIAARRHLSAAETVADYADISTKAIEILAGLVGNETEVPLGDLGTYPAGILPNAFCFDHYAHTRLDLFPPRGPLTGNPHRRVPSRSALPWTGSASSDRDRQPGPGVPRKYAGLPCPSSQNTMITNIRRGCALGVSGDLGLVTEALSTCPPGACRAGALPRPRARRSGHRN